MDNRDKIILEHLFAYSRFTTKQLAKITSLTQQAVSYKIKKLEERGYILRYDAIINWNKIHLIKTIYYIQTSNPKELVKKIKPESPLFGINETIGTHNLILWCFFKSKKQKKEFEAKLRKNDWESLEVDQVFFPQLSIFNLPLKPPIPKQDTKITKLDKIDIKIMKFLANGNARKSVREIGEKLNMNYDVVYYRVKRLIKSGYFFRLAAQIGFTSLDLRLSILIIELKEKTNTSKILENLQKTGFFVAGLAGKNKIHLHIFSQTLEEYWKRIEKVTSLLGKNYKKIDHLAIKSTPLLNRYPLEYLLKGNRITLE